FVRRLTLTEKALAEFVTAISQRAARTVRIRVCLQMFSGFNGAATPRASRELVRRADSASDKLIATSLFDRFDGIFGAIRRRPATNPKSNAKRSLAPTTIAMFERLSSNRLARTNQCRRTLKLLDREQAQGVPHQHSDTLIAVPSGHNSL